MILVLQRTGIICDLKGTKSWCEMLESDGEAKGILWRSESISCDVVVTCHRRCKKVRMLWWYNCRVTIPRVVVVIISSSAQKAGPEDLSEDDNMCLFRRCSSRP